jgi:hypothetical protein
MRSLIAFVAGALCCFVVSASHDHKKDGRAREPRNNRLCNNGWHFLIHSLLAGNIRERLTELQMGLGPMP